MNNCDKYNQLSADEMETLTGGWTFWGWDAEYTNQTFSTSGPGADRTGSYGAYYVMGIKTKEGFRTEDWTDDLY